MQTSKNTLALTIKGVDKANDLVRAHRLWESYQVNQMGLTEEQIHDEADRFEHLLTKELLDEVDQKLGYPDADPHGSPIPKIGQLPGSPLLALKPNSRGVISKEQINDYIESELWELGLLPKMAFVVKKIGKENVFITISGNKEIKVPAALARQINIV